MIASRCLATACWADRDGRSAWQVEIPGPDGAEDESPSVIPACGIEQEARGIAPLLRPLGPHDPDQVLRQIAKGYPDDPRIDLKDFQDDPAHPLAVLV